MLVDLQDSVCGFKIKTVHDFLKKHFGYAREVEFVDRELASRYFGKKGGDVIDELICRGWLERKDPRQGRTVRPHDRRQSVCNHKNDTALSADQR